ncbi:FadR/GntR family transcriptional regulator [Planotetraspora kaengkrachanensis]|uniref:GntR family transcriptional regulator n=1 Tax=Planotetraspora kaengkrachanensis TaxID=575193 RepID=A0A8J3LY43_9ACTN|nr:FCD domain-containing protein [Planotetraspora kaengkrachanensis]GIG78875.1 GntR family transcriptional regulator [Planotetraspora kaengkrachanensis]
MAAGAGKLGDERGDPDRYRPGYELVAEQLLAYMAEHELRPGDRLPTEKGLAEILGATRNVTREAVKVLAAIGRLSVRKGAGIFVASSGAPTGLTDEGLGYFQPTDLQQVVMLLDYRQLIEGETARRAATLATPIQVRSLRGHAEQSAVAAGQADAKGFADADALFHDAVGAAAQNVFLQAAVTNIRRFAMQSDVLLFHGEAPGSLEVAGAQHIGIADAIADGDSETAAKLMIAHVETTRDQFERRIRDRLVTRT